jgi:hypothetical protein
VKLEHRAKRMPAGFLGAPVADAIEFISEFLAVAIFATVRIVGREYTPANTPEANMAGAKREPSSLVQLTISIGALVS